MAKILVYNPASNRVETYYRSLSSQMPYARKMSVNEFQGFSKSSLMWTDKRAMDARKKLRKSLLTIYITSKNEKKNKNIN